MINHSSVSQARRRYGILSATLLALLAPLITAGPASATAAPDPETVVQQILSETNAIRAEVGLAPLVRNTAMDSVAMVWSQAQASGGVMSHNPNYTRQIPSGWLAAGENVAMGYQYTAVVTAWRNSPGHYANLIGNFTDIGVGYAIVNGVPYYTQDFGRYAPLPTGSASFVKAAYQDVLERTPGDSEVNYWMGILRQGYSRSGVAGGFNNSDEYRMICIGAAYSQVLQRSPDPSGLDFWLGLMRGNRVQPDDLHRIYLNSDEFYLVQGHGTDTGYVTALYTDVIGRAPDPVGLAFWVSVLRQGRGAVVDGLWLADETLQRRVALMYEQLLGRPASDGDKVMWAQFARANGLTTLRSALMGSDEYAARAVSRFP